MKGSPASDAAPAPATPDGALIRPRFGDASIVLALGLALQAAAFVLAVLIAALALLVDTGGSAPAYVVALAVPLGALSSTSAIVLVIGLRRADTVAWALPLLRTQTAAQVLIAGGLAAGSAAGAIEVAALGPSEVAPWYAGAALANLGLLVGCGRALRWGEAVVGAELRRPALAATALALSALLTLATLAGAIVQSGPIGCLSFAFERDRWLRADETLAAAPFGERGRSGRALVRCDALIGMRREDVAVQLDSVGPRAGAFALDDDHVLSLTYDADDHVSSAAIIEPEYGSGVD